MSHRGRSVIAASSHRAGALRAVDVPQAKNVDKSCDRHPLHGRKTLFDSKKTRFSCAYRAKKRESTKKWLTLRREISRTRLFSSVRFRLSHSFGRGTSPPVAPTCPLPSATNALTMEVNPCKKCGRPVSVHAEYCPYCGCVVDRRPFVPASSKSTPAVNRPAPAAPTTPPPAAPTPATPAAPAPTASTVPGPELQDVQRLGAELGLTGATSTPAASTASGAADSDSAAVGTPSSTSTPTPPPAAPETPSVRPSAAPPVAPPPASPTYSDDDDETPRRSGGGMKWALGLLALVIAGCAAGGYYYYDHYLAAPAPAEEKTMARPDTTPAKPAPVADNEAEMREKVITYWDVYAKRSSGLIIQYSNAQLRKMLEAKGFALKTDNSADNASTEGEAQPEQSQVYELTTNKGEVLCRFVLNNDRVYNELWFKYPEDKAAFVKGAAASGFKAGTSADRETKVPTYYSSFASDSVRTYPNTRHDYIVAGNETLKLCRERER